MLCTYVIICTDWCDIIEWYNDVKSATNSVRAETIGAIVLLHLAMAMLRIIVQVRDEVDHEGAPAPQLCQGLAFDTKNDIIM